MFYKFVRRVTEEQKRKIEKRERIGMNIFYGLVIFMTLLTLFILVRDYFWPAFINTIY